MLIEVLRAESARLAEQDAWLVERMVELEARLGQNPRNSSKPPSSEGLDKPAPRTGSLQKRTGRRAGGQDGHDGKTLRQVADPDDEVVHQPLCCRRCGQSLAGRRVTGCSGFSSSTCRRCGWR